MNKTVGIRPVQIATLFLLALACGCGPHSSIPLGNVSGTVTYKGKPLDHGKVIFTPEAGGSGVPAVGAIKPDGSFEMQLASGKRGAPLGKFIVTVRSYEKRPEEHAHDMYFTPKSSIPKKYTDNAQSEFRFEVKVGRQSMPHRIGITKYPTLNRQ